MAMLCKHLHGSCMGVCIWKNKFMMTSSNGNIFRISLIWTNGWVNNREAGDLRRHRAHYDITEMLPLKMCCCLYPVKINPWYLTLINMRMIHYRKIRNWSRDNSIFPVKLTRDNEFAFMQKTVYPPMISWNEKISLHIPQSPLHLLQWYLLSHNDYCISSNDYRVSRDQYYNIK